jgi:predicted nuclease with TOPRIM domain
MEHKRLYEIKIDQLEKEKKNLKVENENLMLQVLELRDDVYDWKQKFKELKKSITQQ